MKSRWMVLIGAVLMAGLWLSIHWLAFVVVPVVLIFLIGTFAPQNELNDG